MPSSASKHTAFKKIAKTIEEKENEHNQKRLEYQQQYEFLKLVKQEESKQQEGTTPQDDPEEAADEQKLFGNKSVSVLSIHEWNTLVSICRTDDQFDPLQVVSRERVRKSILNGIPANLRGEIWCMLCRCQREKAMHGEGMYQKLACADIATKENVAQIKKDITRTFTNYPSTLEYLQCQGKDFNWKSEHGQTMLFNVLVAYSNYDSQIGYVQGMNYIAGMLLMHIQDEEKVFWCILYIMNRKNWRCIYKHEMAKLMELLKTVEQTLERDYKQVWDHLVDNDFTVGAAFSPLFITLYIYQIDHDYAMRIFESFVLDGEQALLRVLYKMIELNTKKILQMDEIELIMYLRTDLMNDCIREHGIETLMDYGDDVAGTPADDAQPA